jgi:hypothetical protein
VGSLDPPGPLLTHLHTVYMAYYLECLPTRLNPRAEKTWFSQVRTRDAAVVGAVGRLAWARGLDRPWPEPRADWRPAKICRAAAQHGALASLQWARANGCDWNAITCSAAVRRGHLALLQWLRANGYDWDEYTCMAAAQGGHLAVLRWARANGCD